MRLQDELRLQGTDRGRYRSEGVQAATRLAPGIGVPISAASPKIVDVPGACVGHAPAPHAWITIRRLAEDGYDFITAAPFRTWLAATTGTTEGCWQCSVNSCFGFCEIPDPLLLSTSVLMPLPERPMFRFIQPALSPLQRSLSDFRASRTGDIWDREGVQSPWRNVSRPVPTPFAPCSRQRRGYSYYIDRLLARHRSDVASGYNEPERARRRFAG